MASTLLKKQGMFFLHLPKTAGYSLSSALEKVRGAQPHPVRGLSKPAGAARYAAGRLGDDIFERTYSFAVVRNPWDWAVSGWKHVTENKMAYAQTPPDFGTFLTGDWREGLSRNPSSLKFTTPELFVWYHCFITQWEHLSDVEGRLAPLSHVVRFEHLEDDLEPVFERLGRRLALPHRNMSRRTSYQDYYTPELVDVVARRDAPLIERFGYRYDDARG